jgi:hypothetical protein
VDPNPCWPSDRRRCRRWPAAASGEDSSLSSSHSLRTVVPKSMRGTFNIFKVSLTLIGRLVGIQQGGPQKKGAVCAPSQGGWHWEC